MKVSTAIALCGILSQVAAAKSVVGYFPNWLYANYPIEQVPVEKYTHINYAFAILNKADLVPAFTDDWAVESGLPKLVNRTHAAGNKVMLSVGGWTGSIKFSSMVAKKDTRKKFIDWNLDFISKYSTDGVDIDWEYPGRQAAGCNEFDEANDAKNFLSLLKELRAALDKKFPNEHKEITMAVHVFPFSVNGEYMKSVKDYVPYFDHINIMAYDINGAWATTTGPNAPLFFEKGKGEPVSFVSSIKGWIDAGVPAEKINAGLAYYGRAIETSENMKSSQYAASKKGAPKGDSDDAYWQDPFCQVDEGGFSGIWKWKNLRSQGIIGKDGKAGNGYTKHWDSVSQTPWLYNEKAKTFISYEDPESIKRKVDSALCLGIGGVMAWDIHQDNGELLDVVHGIHGTKPDNCAELESMAAKRPAANNAKAANNGTDVPVPDASTQDVPVSDDTTQDAPDANVTSQDVPDPNWQPSTTGSSDSPMLTEGGETTPTPEVMPTPEATQIEEDMPQPAADLNQKCQAAEVKCMSGEGSPEYHECVYERFMVRLCAAGTVCRTENGVAACGAPVSDSASTMEMPISQNGGSEMVVGFPEAVSAKDVKEEVMRPSTVSAEPFPAPALVKGTEELEGLYDLVKGTDEVEKPTFDIPEDFVGDNFGDIGSETTGGFTWPAAPTPTA